jgi:hypothetical protein
MKLKIHKLAGQLAAILCCAVLSLAGLVGCGKPAVTTSDDEGMFAEAVAVRKAFESASPSYKNPVNEMLKLVKAGQANATAFREALPQVEMLAANQTISADQKQALEALVAKLKAEIKSH